jgi:dihydroorotase
MNQETITITQPDDWHLHIRDGNALRDALLHTVKRFGRAVIMPNLKPPVTTVDLALQYQARILQALKEISSPAPSFTPLMTLYLTDNTPRAEILKAKEHGIVGLEAISCRCNDK